MDEPNEVQQRGWRRQPERHPRIRPPRSTEEMLFIAITLAAEMFFFVFTLVGSLALLAITAYWWPALPAIIPTHFGIDGKPSAHGSKNTLWLLPAIQIFLMLFMAVLLRYPWAFNYLVTITQENVARQYRRGRLLLAGINAFVAWFFLAIQWQSIQVALGRTTTMGGILSPLFVTAVLVLILLSMLTIILLWATRGK